MQVPSQGAGHSATASSVSICLHFLVMRICSAPPTMVKGACSILHLIAAALWAAMIAIGEMGSGKATQLRIVCHEVCQREDANVVD